MKKLVTDELWAEIEPLLPKHKASLKGGRPRLDDRAALTGIIFVLRSGIPWEMLPQEMGCGSGMTCWRRLDEWNRAGVWKRLQQVLLSKLAQGQGIRGNLDWSRVSVDSASIAAPLASRETGSQSSNSQSVGAKKGDVRTPKGPPNRAHRNENRAHRVVGADKASVRSMWVLARRTVANWALNGTSRSRGKAPLWQS